MSSETIRKKSRKITEIHSRFRDGLTRLAGQRRAIIAAFIKKAEEKKMDEIRKKIGI